MTTVIILIMHSTNYRVFPYMAQLDEFFDHI